MISDKSLFNVTYSTFELCKVPTTESLLSNEDFIKGLGGAIYLDIAVLSEFTGNININNVTLGENDRSNEAYKGRDIFIYTSSFPNNLDLYYNFRFLSFKEDATYDGAYGRDETNYQSESNLLTIPTPSNTSNVICEKYSYKATCIRKSNTTYKWDLMKVLSETFDYAQASAYVYVYSNDVIKEKIIFRGGAHPCYLTKDISVGYIPVITFNGGYILSYSPLLISYLTFSIIKDPKDYIIEIGSNGLLSLNKVTLGGIDSNIILTYSLICVSDTAKISLSNVVFQYITFYYHERRGVGCLCIDKKEYEKDDETQTYIYGSFSDIVFNNINSSGNCKGCCYFINAGFVDNLTNIRNKVGGLGKLSENNQGVVFSHGDYIDLFEGT